MTPMIARVLTFALSLLVLVGAAQSRQQPVPKPANQSSQEQETTRELRSIASELRAIREQAARAEEQRAQHKPEKGPPIWSNWFLIVVAAGTGFAAWRTLRAIEEQVKANRDAVDAARDNAKAAADNAAAARDAADETRRQNQVMEGQSAVMITQLKVAQVAAHAAQQSANVARDALHLTQRADVMFYGIKIHPRMNPSRVTSATVVELSIKNFGPTRATDVQIDVELTITGYPASSLEKMLPKTTIGAGKTVPMAFLPLGKLFGDEAVRKVDERQADLKLVGKISFVDVFGHPNDSKFTAVYHAQASGFMMIDDVGNDERADDN